MSTEALQKWRESGGTVGERLNPIEKARNKPNSLRLAVNAMCFDCQGRDHDPKVKWRIGNCECKECPLYPVRPYQKQLEAE